VTGGVFIVVPCYNEAARLSVEEFVVFARASSDIHLLFVNDGSQDSTAEVLERIRSACPERVEVLSELQNRGKGEAVRLGLLKALQELPRQVGFWDADLATPLSAIARFRERLDADPRLAMVIGARVKLLGRDVRRAESRHYTGRVFATVVSAMLKLAIYDTQCGAKLFRVTELLPDLLAEPFISRWIFDVELLARCRRLERQKGAAPLEEVVYEYPLESWHDVSGSKLRGGDFARAAIDLWRIYWRYCAGEAMSPAPPAP
jgi:dolichyl-phosphate beta-glucosyltransferase